MIRYFENLDYNEIAPSPVKHTEMILEEKLMLRELKQIGSGLFGRVYCARRTATRTANKEDQRNMDKSNALVACKLFDYLDKCFTPIQWKSFLDEVTAFRLINSRNHPNIVRYESDFQMFTQDDVNANTTNVSFVENSHNLVCSPSHRIILSGIIIEKVDMNLSDWMVANGVRCFTEAQAIELFAQIGSALKFIHSKHFLVHGDVKLDNIGVNYNVQADGDSMPQLKLYDFGLSQQYDPSVFEAAESKSAQFSMQDDLHTDLVVNNDAEYMNNPFIYESYVLGRIILNNMIMTDLYSEVMHKFKDERFKAIVLALATQNLSVNSAVLRYRFDY